MPVSNLASLRQFPESYRPRLFVAYAAAREALAAVQRQPYDLILMDLQVSHPAGPLRDGRRFSVSRGRPAHERI